MGIDVWTLRSEVLAAPASHPATRPDTGDIAHESTHDHSHINQAEPVRHVKNKEAQKAQVASSGDAPDFHLCFLNYRSFAICLSINENDEIISPAVRHFCDDIALAINGSTINPGINNLKWPNGNNKNASAEDANSNVTQRINGLPGLVLIFGSAAADNIPGIDAPKANVVLDLDGRKIIVVNAVEKLCREPGSKKLLWQLLQSSRR